MISSQELDALLASSPLIVDVRTPAEFAAGTLAGAVNVPIATVPAFFATMSRERVVVCVCTYGQRSSSACAELRRLGFSNARFLDGGLSAWSAAGLPLSAKQ